MAHGHDHLRYAPSLNVTQDRIKQMWNDVDLGAIESLSVLRDSPFGSKECRMGDKDFCLVGVQPSGTCVLSARMSLLLLQE